MPYRRRASYRRGIRPVITSIKNVFQDSFGILGTQTNKTIAVAKNTPDNLNTTEVSIGCLIKAIYITFDVCGLAGSGTLNNATMYVAKNPGTNLTMPAPETIGSSNEKKFIFKFWRAMIMRNQDGNVPYHWEGWIKVPRRYQRMGTDDIFQFVVETSATLTGHCQLAVIYKWYR